MDALCIAHVPARKQAATFTAISRGHTVDCFRGVTLDRRLLDTLLDAAPRNSEGRTLLTGANFTRTFFPRKSNLSELVFRGACSFVGAEFAEDLELTDTVFQDDLDLSWVTCWAGLRCHGTIFQGSVSAMRATFLGPVDFSEALLLREVNLYRAMFSTVPVFSKAEFRGLLLGVHTEFPSQPDFSDTIFSLPPVWR